MPKYGQIIFLKHPSVSREIPELANYNNNSSKKNNNIGQNNSTPGYNADFNNRNLLLAPHIMAFTDN